MNIYIISTGNNYGEDYKIRFTSINYDKALEALKAIIDIEEKQYNDAVNSDSFEEIIEYSETSKYEGKTIKYWSNDLRWIRMESFVDDKIYTPEWYN